MGRLSIVFILISSSCSLATASENLPVGAAAPSQAAVADKARCAAYGEDFFAVKGSDACIRITGRISVGAGFGDPHPTHSGGPPVDGASALATGSELSTSADVRFNTPVGEGRIYVHARNPAANRWLFNSP